MYIINGSPHNDFMSILQQEVEQKQEDDDNTGTVIVAKSGKGKGKCRQRVTVSETKPSQMGRRVIPRIDPAIIARAGQEANAKRKKAMVIIKII